MNNSSANQPESSLLLADKAALRRILEAQDKQTGFVFDPNVTPQQARELMLAQGIDPEDNAFCRLRRMQRHCGATQ